jgi:hypothetical protein
MAVTPVNLRATPGLFDGLASQNMLFHECLAELIDNSIAANNESSSLFDIAISIDYTGFTEIYEIWISDSSGGMGKDLLAKALQPGESATTSDRLNEHGFGLKNALATLTKGLSLPDGEAPWTLWTRISGEPQVYSVEGPFAEQMEISDERDFPSHTSISDHATTVICAKVSLEYMRTVRGRGPLPSLIDTFAIRVTEHLGVLYRGYLEFQQTTNQPLGRIRLLWNGEDINVPAIQLPLADSHIERFKVDVAGKSIACEYVWGALDTEKRKTWILGRPTSFYYLGNQPTQGIDIRLRGRTIATRQFEQIWKTGNGQDPLARHNSYDHFLGELRIPPLPRGVLTTTNNKTNVNMDDPDWLNIFAHLNAHYRPRQNQQKMSEADLRDKFARHIRAFSNDHASLEKVVWPMGARIDIFRKSSGAEEIITVYELKMGRAQPQALYQLKMYWDGLCLAGEYPHEGILLCDEFTSLCEEMVEKMNALPPPPNSRPYCFSLKTIDSFPLRSRD